MLLSRCYTGQITDVFINTTCYLFLGALTGFSTSLAFVFWMGFGRPRPIPTKLIVSTESCTAHPILSAEVAFPNATVIDEPPPTPLKPDDNSDYFYLYRISYAWYACIGFMLTLVIGIVTSLLFNLYLKQTFRKLFKF